MNRALEQACRIATTLAPPPSAVLQLAQAEDRIAELEEMLGLTMAQPSILNLSPTLARMLGLLRTRERWPRDAMFRALYGGLPECDQPEVSIVKTNIRYLRSALKTRDIKIMSEIGPDGNAVYFMTFADKARLKQVLS